MTEVGWHVHILNKGCSLVSLHPSTMNEGSSPRFNTSGAAVPHGVEWNAQTLPTRQIAVGSGEKSCQVCQICPNPVLTCYHAAAEAVVSADATKKNTNRTEVTRSLTWVLHVPCNTCMHIVCWTEHAICCIQHDLCCIFMLYSPCHILHVGCSRRAPRLSTALRIRRR